jgi:uncharacterized protein YlaN (UPF0358 family)
MASNNRDGPWPIAATLYRICRDNSQAGSLASIVDEEGRPRWYALWALIRYLRSYHNDFTGSRGRPAVSGQRSPPKGDDSQPSRVNKSTRILRLGLPGEKPEYPSEFAVSASTNPSIGPGWVTGTSEGLAGQVAITDKDDACSTLRPTNSPDLAAVPESRCKDVVQASVSGPRTSSSLPSLVVQIPISSSESKTLEKDLPMNTDTLSRLQSLTASRVRNNKAAKRSAYEQRRLASCHVKQSATRLEDLKLQMIQAEEELREARKRKVELEAAEEKHNHTAQCYHNLQKDLEELARMRGEQIKRLRALNVPLSEEMLEASMSPMIRGVANKCPDIASDDAFINAEDSAE